MNRKLRCLADGRPRLLFVTYTFPPARTAGSVRTWNIAKYLARAGWGVTVLTPNPSVWRRVENPEQTEVSLAAECIRRLATDHRWRWLAGSSLKCRNERLASAIGGVWRRLSPKLGMDNAVGWISSAERACEMLNARDVDVVLASGPAFSAFSAAQRLGRRLRCPYVLDYRDLWSRNLHRPVPAAVRTEASLLAGSAAVTTVSPSWRTVLDQDFGVRAKSHVVSNGYDPESLADVRPQKFDHFAIVYTGTLWPPKRPITPLMAALTRLEQIANDRQKRWMFHYYGRSEQHVREEAERFGISRRVVVHGEVTRGMALSAVKGCGVAVVITSVADAAERADNGMVTGKIFETVGLGTPILLIAPTTSDANAVIQTAGVGQGIPANDTDGIALFLRGLMDGTVPPVKDPAAYSWASIVGVLSSILHGVIAR